MVRDDTEAEEETLCFLPPVSILVGGGKGAVPTIERQSESTSTIDIGSFEITQEDDGKKLSNIRGKIFRTSDGLHSKALRELTSVQCCEKYRVNVLK